MWNSALETSIMCTFAVREAAAYQFEREIEEGRRFILNYSERWFENKLFADGLWAYRILHLDSLAENNYFKYLQDFVYKTKDASFTTNRTYDEKNDKSLGLSHIVKTYLELAYDFVNFRPIISCRSGESDNRAAEKGNVIPESSISGGESDMIKHNDIPKFKIAVTFTGKYRDLVRGFCQALMNYGFTQNEIFLDEWHDDLINGPDGDTKLRIIYQTCDLDVVLLSPDYKNKKWTFNIEWQAVKERINKGDDKRICLLSVDGINIKDIDGIYTNQAITKVVDSLAPNDIATFIKRKYDRL